MPRSRRQPHNLGLLSSFQLVASGFSNVRQQAAEEGWGTTGLSREYLHKGRFLKERATVKFAPSVRDSQLLLTHRAALRLPVTTAGHLDSELELPQMLRHALNWPTFPGELKISSRKVLNNPSSMPRKGDRGRYRNLSSNMLLFAHGLSIPTSRRRRQTNC